MNTRSTVSRSRTRSATFSDGRCRGASGVGALATLAVLATAAFLWLRGGSASEEETIDPDRVVVVAAKDLIDAVNTTGRIEPLARVAVMSRASGIIEELLVDEGDVVTEGQVLIELDREQLEAQWQQDEADRAAAEARVRAAEARVAEARVRIDDPEPAFLTREFARVEELFADGDVSARERDDAERALATARFRVDQAKANLPVLEAAVAEAQAGLASANAALERSATALREATILSPIDGLVLIRHREIGDGVSSILTGGSNATEILTLGDLESVHVEARADEVDLGRIRVGMPALITVDAHRGVTLEGAVEKIAPAGSIDDNGIVTFRIEVSVEDPDGLLKPDMTAEARLVIDRRDEVLVLPQVAMQRAGTGADGRWEVERIVGEGEQASVERVVVTLGLSDGLLTEVRSGLAEGDRVLLPIARTGR